MTRNKIAANFHSFSFVIRKNHVSTFVCKAIPTTLPIILERGIHITMDFNPKSFMSTSDGICCIAKKFLLLHNCEKARRAGSDGSMSTSGSAGSGFNPGGVVNFQPRS